MNSFFTSVLGSVSANALTDIFFSVMLVAFILAVICHFKKVNESYIAFAPNLLTSLGILGTFSGIVIGLLDFNPKDIDGSIEVLLAGLKTAFMTSLGGMAASILLKLITTISFKKESIDENSLDQVGPEDIHAAIVAQHQYAKDQTDALLDLKHSIVGEGDKSIFSQLSSLRLDTNDNAKKSNQLLSSMNEKMDKIYLHHEEQKIKFEEFRDHLWIELQNFADVLSKSATEQVIEALKQVIVEFNNNLTEQFGENFKRLDESVKKLVVWQDNYKTQLEEMSEQYKLGVTSISQTEISVASISEQAQSIPISMIDLKAIMEANSSQLKELESHLNAFVEMRDKAVEAVPEMKAHLDATMNDISGSVELASKHYSDMLSKSDEFIREHSAAQKEIQDNFVQVSKEGIEQVKTGLMTGAESISGELNQGAKDLSAELATQAIKVTELSEDVSSNLTSSSGSIQTASDYLVTQTETIRTHLKDATDEINAELRVLVADIKAESLKTVSNFESINNELNTNTKAVQGEVISSINKLQDRLGSCLEEVFQEQTRKVSQTFESLEDQIGATVGQTGKAVEKQVGVLDEAMQKEVNRVMQEMGSALATIAGQFTSDYKELTNEMHRITRANRAA